MNARDRIRGAIQTLRQGPTTRAMMNAAADEFIAASLDRDATERELAAEVARLRELLASIRALAAQVDQ